MSKHFALLQGPPKPNTSQQSAVRPEKLSFSLYSSIAFLARLGGLLRQANRQRSQ